MPFLLGEKDGIRIAHGQIGEVLNQSLAKCIELCEKEDCELILNFNGVERLINKGSYVKGLVDNWFNNDYVPLQDSRDKKLTDLGI